MAIRRRQPPPLVTVAIAAFIAALVAFGLLARGDGPASDAGTPVRGDAGNSLAGAARSTDARIAQLQRAVRAAPENASASALLGLTYLQKVRETGDAGFYERADAVLHDALKRSPSNLDALVGLGQLALARHDFRAALAWGQRARAAHPGPLAPYPVLIDANIELGRYGVAERELQQFVDLKPNLAGYARVAYVRELRGDLPGAVAAMRLAISAGGDATENVAYVQTLLGNLEFQRGRLAAAKAAYGAALARVPDYAPASAGVAHVASAGGNLSASIDRLRSVVARLPLTEYIVALGEAELAAGRAAAARKDLALVSAETQLSASRGVNSDAELALFEADHGSPAKAVTLAQRSWAQAPSVRSADAVGWALTRAGRPAEGYMWGRRALRLGSRDASFLYHAGMSARAAGRVGPAKELLRRSLSLNPRFSPLYAPRAQRALARMP